MPESKIDVEVAYATRERQLVIPLSLPEGSSVEDALLSSGVFELVPELKTAPLTLGIFAQICGATRLLMPGDRVEIYRPLVNNPKEIRRQRAHNK